MPDPVVLGSMNPLGYKGFLSNSSPSLLQTNSSVNVRRTVSTPVLVCLVVSSVTKKTWILRNVTMVQSDNVIGNTIPYGELDFVLNPGEDLPPFGPMDELYVFASDNDAVASINTGTIGFDPTLPGSQNFIATQNRIFTGLVSRVVRKWDRGAGKTFAIMFSTFMKKFDITSEMKPLLNLKNLGYGVAQGVPQPLSVAIAMSESFMGAPGALVRGACNESNVQWKYIYDPISQVDQSTKATFYDSYKNLSPLVYPDGIRTDEYNITLNAEVTIFATLNAQSFNFNPMSYQYQTWSNWLSLVTESNFCEMFFSRFGQFYYRQIGMFLPAGKWDYTISPELIVDYQDWEDSDEIVTELELTIDTASAGQQNYIDGGVIFGAPNIKQLETLYGRRYQQIEVPNAYWAQAANSKYNPAFKQSKQQILDYMAAYSQYYMAMKNANNIRGVATLLGWPDYEVGSTCYFPHVDRVFYIQEVKHYFEVGRGWNTALTLMYGRPSAADLYNYISQRAIVLGIDPNASTSNLSSSGNTILNVTNSSIPPLNNFDAQFPDQPNKYSPMVGTNPDGITQDYGVQEPPGSLEPVHTGVDLAVKDGTHLTSVVNGTVGWVNYDPSTTGSEGWGYFIIIHADSSPNTPDFDIAYAHMDQPSPLTIGDRVTIGQLVGYVGSTGNATGPHVHFEVFQHGTETDNFWPPYLTKTTANPWKVISISNPQLGPASPFVNHDVNDVPQGNLIWQSSTQWHPKGAWRDPNYKTDVRTFGNYIANVLGGKPEFYMALSALEVNWGKDIMPAWNFANVKNTNARPNGGDDNTYHNVTDGAQAWIDFVNNGSKFNTYQPFLNYMQDSADSFDSGRAAVLLYIDGHYIDPPDLQRADSLAQICNSLLMGQWNWG
jgi:murein DD-endopeptidase MepM/ murein hydrolase activator NlpD